MNIHLKTAFDYIRRSPFQAVAAFFVLTLTFFVATNMAILAYASGQSLKYFETRPQIIAFIKDDGTSETISALQNKLTLDTRIKDVRYVPKEEALEIYKKATEDNPLIAELVSPSIFPASLEFSVVDLQLAQNVIDEVKAEAIVDQVGFTASLSGEKSLNTVVARLKTISQYVRYGGLILVGILAFTSFLVLLIIITMRMATRKSEVEILNLIGARPGFIRNPIVLEAIIYSLLGVFIGWILSFISWLYLTPSVVAYFGQISILPREPLQFFIIFLIILAAELIVGLFLAVTGSLFAVNRALKRLR